MLHCLVFIIICTYSADTSLSLFKTLIKIVNLFCNQDYLTFVLTNQTTYVHLMLTAGERTNAPRPCRPNQRGGQTDGPAQKGTCSHFPHIHAVKVTQTYIHVFISVHVSRNAEKKIHSVFTNSVLFYCTYFLSRVLTFYRHIDLKRATF